MSAENTTEGDLHLQESRLCSRCRRFDSGHKPRIVFVLRDLDPICPLCTYSKGFLLKEGLPTGIGCVLMRQKGYLTRTFEFLLNDSSYDFASLIVFHDEFLFNGRSERLVECSESSSYPDNTILPKLIDSRRADFDLMKDWMDHCMSKHNCGPGPTSIGTIPNQHVIDCYTRKVIPVPRGCDYAALSYVWGQSQTASCHGEILGTVPRTIEDAIQVTQIMRTRYLWVDRYCILQNNAQHKMEQIHSMHKIYSNAKFTIVAAAGEDPDHGLPGVSDQHRCEQPQVHLGCRLMVSTLSNPSNLIYSSKWWERGWTYQECMHSRRLLFFTNEQVYFQCSKTAFCESLHVPTSLGMQRDPKFGFFEGLDVWSSINQYLRRKLTHPSDILNAIISVLQRFQEEQDAGFRHLWGLPILRDPDDRYDITCWSTLLNAALLWTFEGSALRRKGFPSWSWTGWFGNDFTPYKHPTHLQALYGFDGSLREKKYLFPPNFLLNTSDRGLIWVENFLAFSHDETPSSVLQVEAHVVRLRIESGEFDFKVGTNERRSVYALNYDGKSTFLAKVIKGEDFFKRSLVCSLHSAVQDSKANYLGIIMGSTCFGQRNEKIVFLLIVEEKGTLFERIGICSASYNTVLSAETQVQLINLG